MHGTGVGIAPSPPPAISLVHQPILTPSWAQHARGVFLFDGLDILQAAIRLYTRGLTDFLDVLESQRSLYASEDQLVQSERAVAVSLIAVYKALGGGWEAWLPD